MEWALYCSDELTGLIVAVALVMPDRKLASVAAESVTSKFAQKSFAAGVDRQKIALCEEQLGITLDEFVGIVLESMQGISEEVGL
jgi:predicted hydrolase (HD superfamily)